MAALKLVLALTLCAAGQSLAQATAAVCSLDVQVVYPQAEGGEPEPVCSSSCSNDAGEMWYDGVAYKKFPELQEQFNQMVAVEFQNGVLTSCKTVPYASDEQLRANAEELQGCLAGDQDLDIPTTPAPITAAPTTAAPTTAAPTTAAPTTAAPTTAAPTTAAPTTAAPTTAAPTTAAPTTPAPYCADGFTMLGGSCYLVSDTAVTMKAATTYCNSLGAFLANIDDQLEQDTLAGFLTASVYIGLNDEAEEGTFAYTGKSGTPFTNWNDGEPNNTGNEDCVVMKDNKEFRWNDVKCSKTFLPLCEMVPFFQ